MDETLRTIITYVVTFAGGYLSRYVEPRAKLVHWFPGWVTFAVPLPAPAPGPAPKPALPPGPGPAPAAPAPSNVNVSTHTLTVQNVGWRPASRVEILHGQAPQLFRFVPQVNFTQGATPAGEHVITIESLAPREWVALHVLTVGNFPPLRSVRSARGPLDAGDDAADVRHLEVPQAGVPGVAGPRRRDGDLLALADRHATDTSSLGLHLEVAVVRAEELCSVPLKSGKEGSSMVTMRCYGVHVDDPSKKASAGCVAFVHRLNDQHRAAEFRIAASTFDDSGLSIPSSRQATFREQFRLANVAHDVFAGGETDDEQFIAGKMREAFGSGVEVAVTFIEPATRFGP